MGFVVTGTRPIEAADPPPAGQPPAEAPPTVNRPGLAIHRAVRALLWLPRFILGNLGGTYYAALPMFVYFKVRARPGRLSALIVFHSESVLCSAFVWVRGALNSQKRWFPGRAERVLRRLRLHRLAGTPGRGPAPAVLDGAASPWVASHFHAPLFILIVILHT